MHTNRAGSFLILIIIIVVPCRASQHVWNAQVTARGRRMPGSCGVLPGYTFKISRIESTTPSSWGEVTGLFPLGEKKGPRTKSFAWCKMILSRRTERKDFYSTALCRHQLSSRGEGIGEILKRTVRLDSAGR